MNVPNFGNYIQQQSLSNPHNQSLVQVTPQQMQQMQMMQQQQNANNPFAMEQYRSINIPDMPLQFGNNFTDSLLNDNEVPVEVKKKHWYVFHKDNTLTFLDEARKQNKMLSFDIIKIDILNSIPYYDYSFDKELEFTVLRNVFETKLDRAMGFKSTNIKNERTVLQSQFTENRQISEDGTKQVKEGFFKRLLGRR